MPVPYVISEEKRARPELVGAKAWNLFLLKRRFRIPEFTVVTALAYESWRQTGRMVSAVEKELRESVARMLEKGPLAVRSSGTAEDMPGHSFAGMYETTLNVRTVEEALAAVIRTWQSVNTRRVKQYRSRMNVPAGEMAVILQHQLTPQTSGVMVTKNPAGGNEIIIECARGLGDKLVSGAVTPSQYRLKNNRVIDRRGEDLLSKKHIVRLAKCGRRIERRFKSPQDIEWAIEDDEVFILQARPVLVHEKTRVKSGRVWCNANVRETIPDPVTPLMWSIFEEHMFPGIIIDAFGLPIDREQYARFPGVERVLGRLYWNCNSTLAYAKSIGFLFSVFQADFAVDPQMARAMRSIDARAVPKVISTPRMFLFSLVAGVRLNYYLLLSFFRYRWLARRVVRAFEATDRLQASLKTSDDFKTGCTNVRTWLAYVTDLFARRYFGGIFLGIFYMLALTKLLGLRLGKKGEAAARRSALGIIDKTSEMVLSISEMVGRARNRLVRITSRGLRRLYRTDRQFRALFDRFLSNFGHRGPGEFDVASINWAEDHDMVYDLIVTSQGVKPCIERRRVIDELLRSLPSFERIVLKMLIPRLEALYPLRENGKHYYFRLGWRIKEQLLIMDRILRQEKYTMRPRDIFFLTLPDLEAIAGRQLTVGQARRLIRERKEEWDRFKKIEPPDIVYESGEQYFEPLAKDRVLTGEPLTFGRVAGRARIIKNYCDSHRLRRGEIMVTNHADPGWTPLFNVASGVIVEVGGLACHAAMVARELGVPAIVVRGATKLIRDGQMVELDADLGTVDLKIKRPEAKSSQFWVDR